MFVKLPEIMLVSQTVCDVDVHAAVWDSGSMTKDDSKIFYRELGDRIRRHRERVGQGMTQEELGRRVSLSRTSIVNIEKGRQHLAAHQVYIFAAALKVRPEALLPSQAGDGSFVAGKLPANVDKAIIKWAEKLV